MSVTENDVLENRSVVKIWTFWEWCTCGWYWHSLIRSRDPPLLRQNVILVSALSSKKTWLQQRVQVLSRNAGAHLILFGVNVRNDHCALDNTAVSSMSRACEYDWPEPSSALEEGLQSSASCTCQCSSLQEFAKNEGEIRGSSSFLTQRNMMSPQMCKNNKKSIALIRMQYSQTHQCPHNTGSTRQPHCHLERNNCRDPIPASSKEPIS